MLDIIKKFKIKTQLLLNKTSILNDILIDNLKIKRLVLMMIKRVKIRSDDILINLF
jgi:hypothetical protein